MAETNPSFDQWYVVEKWLPIPGYEGYYEVSDLGSIRSIDRRVIDKSGRVQHVKQRNLALQNNNGYWACQLWKNNHMKRPLVHVIVAQAFIGTNPDGLDVNHIDGNKKNNAVSNLEYCSRSENNFHACRIGLRKTGENHPWAKLSADQVKEIRLLNKEQGLGCRKLSKIYGVAKETIISILNNSNWKNL